MLHWSDPSPVPPPPCSCSNSMRCLCAKAIVLLSSWWLQGRSMRASDGLRVLCVNSSSAPSQNLSNMPASRGAPVNWCANSSPSMVTFLSAGREANILKTSKVEDGSRGVLDSRVKSPLARQTDGVLCARLST